MCVCVCVCVCACVFTYLLLSRLDAPQGQILRRDQLI